ncbi:hypothetical protein AGIG_G17108 [Arapaima gigas]
MALWPLTSALPPVLSLLFGLAIGGNPVDQSETDWVRISCVAEREHHYFTHVVLGSHGQDGTGAEGQVGRAGRALR